MLWALLHPKLMKTHTKSKCHVNFIKIKPLSKYFLIWSDIMSALRHCDPEVKGLIAGLRTLSLSFTLLFVVLYESWHKNRNKTDILDKSLICFTYQHAMLSCCVFPSPVSTFVRWSPALQLRLLGPARRPKSWVSRQIDALQDCLMIFDVWCA